MKTVYYLQDKITNERINGFYTNLIYAKEVLMFRQNYYLIAHKIKSTEKYKNFILIGQPMYRISFSGNVFLKESLRPRKSRLEKVLNKL